MTKIGIPLAEEKNILILIDFNSYCPFSSLEIIATHGPGSRGASRPCRLPLGFVRTCLGCAGPTAKCERCAEGISHVTGSCAHVLARSWGGRGPRGTWKRDSRTGLMTAQHTVSCSSKPSRVACESWLHQAGHGTSSAWGREQWRWRGLSGRPRAGGTWWVRSSPLSPERGYRQSVASAPASSCHSQTFFCEHASAGTPRTSWTSRTSRPRRSSCK